MSDQSLHSLDYIIMVVSQDHCQEGKNMKKNEGQKEGNNLIIRRIRLFKSTNISHNDQINVLMPTVTDFYSLKSKNDFVKIDL